MSTVTAFGMSSGRASTGNVLERLDKHSAEFADGLGLPGKNNRHLSGHSLRYIDVHEIDVEQGAVDRVPLHLTDEADVAFRAPFHNHLNRNVGSGLG